MADEFLDVAQAAAAIAAGKVVAIPTDTVYGLACSPRKADAVERIYAIKHRPAGMELTLLVAEIGDLTGLVAMNPTAERLAARFWPGALSIVLRAASPSLGIPRRGNTLSSRIPDHATLRELLRLTGPLATTSANRHGRPAALTAAEAVATLGRDIVGVLDGGSGGGMASTVVDCSDGAARVLRPGPVSDADIAACLDA